jgi:hypothetical protein
MIMTVISRALMACAQTLAGDSRQPQFKNAIMTLASEAAVLVPDDPAGAISVFQDLLEEIRRVIYYRPKKPRPSQPRVTKTSVNKWSASKNRRLTNA